MRPGFYQTENKRSVAVQVFPFNFENMRRQVQLNTDIERAVFIRGFQEGYDHDPGSCLRPCKKKSRGRMLKFEKEKKENDGRI